MREFFRYIQFIYNVHVIFSFFVGTKREKSKYFKRNRSYMYVYSQLVVFVREHLVNYKFFGLAQGHMNGAPNETRTYTTTQSKTTKNLIVYQISKPNCGNQTRKHALRKAEREGGEKEEEEKFST